MNLYEKFVKKRKNNNLPTFEEITAEELEQLFITEMISDNRIAELFDVKKSKVTYRRRKNGITIRKGIVDEVLNPESEKGSHINTQVKEDFFISDNLDLISKAITHFAFRNGPIESMHAHPNNQLSDEDMKTLNKFMVDRLAYIFDLIINEKWLEFSVLINQLNMYGDNWDEAQPDDGGNKEIVKRILERR
ncbi:hypothetical protein [Pseudogracilibacillus auburnensis]|uniref:hypothetical protein n=1 Tax=Pseudogracilibacillus auburnensis TaxID=1494959 RepID=UPI001A97443C|nr:hypothetical protein [Pseudogracilibacillus auburnensis]MBO1001840.1 hypothetical protein [Pseudogracilibacillus auburnensis]